MAIHMGGVLRAEKLESRVRRQQIAQAALDLAATGGLRRLRVGAVARRVGLSTSALYRHFPSKERMVDAALDLIEERLQANVEAVIAETGDPLERLRQLALRHARLIRENQAIPRVFFSDEVFAGVPARRARVYGLVTRYLGHVAQMVREGQERGQIRREVDPATASRLFLGMVVPGAILWHMSDGSFDVTRHVRDTWPLYHQALRAPQEEV